MKRILIVKTSSMGDVIHTLPAVTDACRKEPSLRFDWVVEEGFREIPSWHPAVERVIPVAIRRWRKKPWSLLHRQQWRAFKQQINAVDYDLIIDAQGLLKSAWLTRLASGPRHGYDRRSAREPIAALFYHHKHAISKQQHAITRVRQLFASVLGYDCPTTVVDYGLDLARLAAQSPNQRYLIFLHGTTWASKHWPESYWIELARLAVAAGVQVYLPWGNAVEHARAERIMKSVKGVEVLPALSLKQLAGYLKASMAVVGVDSGLAHLSAALAVPSITLYGSTRADLTGALGIKQSCLVGQASCSPCLRRHCTQTQYEIPPCYQDLSPQRVWNALTELMQTWPQN